MLFQTRIVLISAGLSVHARPHPPHLSHLRRSQRDLLDREQEQRNQEMLKIPRNAEEIEKTRNNPIVRILNKAKEEQKTSLKAIGALSTCLLSSLGVPVGRPPPLLAVDEELISFPRNLVWLFAGLDCLQKGKNLQEKDSA